MPDQIIDLLKESDLAEEKRLKAVRFARELYQEWKEFTLAEREELGKIITIDNSEGQAILNQPSALIDRAAFESPELRRLLTRLLGVVQDVGGLGLAAAQLGEPHRVFVAYAGKAIKKERIWSAERSIGDFQFFSNLIWRESSGAPKDFRRETCLSIPNKFFEISRWRMIDIEYDTPWGEHILEQGIIGRLARIIQHEADHGQGITAQDQGKDYPMFQGDIK